MLTSGELVWLLAAVSRGDQEAFQRLYTATSAKLYGVVLRILRRGDLAEEVLQETYVRVWRRAAEFNPAQATPITWMVAIARNHALDVARKKSVVVEEPLGMDGGSDMPEPLVRREMTEDLKRLLACMGNLEEERRRLILLAYYSGWTREELAARFDKPANTIRTWLRRSLLQVRECLEA